MTPKLFLSFTLIILLSQCKPESDYRALVQNVKINPAYEMNPPIADNIYIKELEQPDADGNNFQLIAEFDKELMNETYHAIMVGDDKIVLRDDGKFGDEKAGDKMFTFNLREDKTELIREIENRQKLLINDQAMAIFENRTVQPVLLEEIRKFSIKDFRKGQIFKLPKDFFNPRPMLSDHTKTLMITNTLVVEDSSRTFNPCTNVGNPNGPWTFGELIRQMASDDPASLTDLQTSDFVRKWLNAWRSDTIVNGDPVPARTNINNLITDWENKSGVVSGGILKMEFAPFKLMAIVNRLDLRGNSGYGFSNAGEGRLVYNALSPSCQPLQFTVIFEYGVNKKSCAAIKAYAQEWNNLNALTIGSPEYNDALEQITNQFTLANTGSDDSLTINGSSLNQLRTNENHLNPVWELREFVLVSPGHLSMTTVKQEPAGKYNAKISNTDVERLVNFINTNSASIEANNYTVPNVIPTGGTPPTTAFLGGRSLVPTLSTHWNGTSAAGPTFINSDSARHIFSLNTCNGCHGGETNTVFTHIKPAPFGTAAPLSGFLTGITVSDPAGRPAGSPKSRTFNDLERRRVDLANLIDSDCRLGGKRGILSIASRLRFKPVRMTH